MSEQERQAVPQPLEAGLQQNLSQFICARVSTRAHACFGAPPPPSYTVVGLSLKASQGPLRDHMPIMLTNTSLLGMLGF